MTPVKIMTASRTRAATKPSATPSFCRLITGYRVTAVPMQAMAMITSRKPPTSTPVWEPEDRIQSRWFFTGP